MRVAEDIYLTPADWKQFGELPIQLPPNATQLLRSADPGQRRVLDYGLSIGLLQVGAGGLLAIDSLTTQGVGDLQQGKQDLATYVDQPQGWPSLTVVDGAQARWQAERVAAWHAPRACPALRRVPTRCPWIPAAAPAGGSCQLDSVL